MTTVTTAELEARPHRQQIIPWHLVENGLVDAPIEAHIRAHLAHLCLPGKVIILTEIPRDPATLEASVRISLMIELWDFVIEQPRTPRVPGKVRSKWKPHADAVPWLEIYGDDEGRNRSMGNMWWFEPGTPVDYLRFASDSEQDGTFNIYVPSRLNRREPPQGFLQRCYLESLVKSEFPERMDPASVRVWIKPKRRAPQATLRQLSALVDEWRDAVRAAPLPLGGEVVILARDLVSTHDGYTRWTKYHGELEKLDERMDELRSQIDKARSIGALNKFRAGKEQLSAEIKRLEAERPDLVEKIVDYDPESTCLRLEVDLRHTHQETVHALLAMLATFSETVYPLRYVLFA